MKKWNPYKKYGVLSDEEILKPEDKVDIDQLVNDIGEDYEWGAGIDIRDVRDKLEEWISEYCKENNITLSESQGKELHTQLWAELKEMEMDSLD